MDLGWLYYDFVSVYPDFDCLMMDWTAHDSLRFFGFTSTATS